MPSWWAFPFSYTINRYALYSFDPTVPFQVAEPIRMSAIRIPSQKAIMIDLAVPLCTVDGNWEPR